MSSSAITTSDFAHALDKLDSSGSNWVIFQKRFIIAVKQKKVYAHFDGTASKPTVSDPTDATQVQALTEWQEKEDLAMYLLSQKLPDSTLTKYMRRDTVAEMWSGIVTEFTSKSMLMRSNLHTKFMGMRYKPGANLHTEFDRVRVEYEALLNAGVSISDNDYCTLIINFAPPKLSSFIAQISANTKTIITLQHEAAVAAAIKASKPLPTLSISDYELAPEVMMQTILEEYDRLESAKSAKEKSKASSSTGIAAAVSMSSEKPGQKTGAGRRWRGKKTGSRRGGKSSGGGDEVECFNCGGRGHKSPDCPSPRKDRRDDGKSGGRPTGKGDGKPKPSGPSGAANTATLDLDEVAGAWSAQYLDDEIIFADFRHSDLTADSQRILARIFPDDDILPDPRTWAERIADLAWIEALTERASSVNGYDTPHRIYSDSGSDHTATTLSIPSSMPSLRAVSDSVISDDDELVVRTGGDCKAEAEHPFFKRPDDHDESGAGIFLEELEEEPEESFHERIIQWVKETSAMADGLKEEDIPFSEPIFVGL